ncbi:MAG: hypothetical protein IJ002_01230 [Clostridia bacterium]|nr:hypothetical protein [Clostridia bacterium]
MILSLSDISELKKQVAERFSVTVHFCDSCGGQSFTVEEPTESLKAFITDFFFAKDLNVVFSENGEHFTVRRNS